MNSWDGRPLLNACVLCLYRIHSLLLHSQRWHCYTLWVLQSLLGWTLRFFSAWSRGQRWLFSLAFCSNSDGSTTAHRASVESEEFCFAQPDAQQSFTASDDHLWFILMHLPSLPVLRPQIRIIRCVQTSGTLTHPHTCVPRLLVSCFPPLSCLHHSQLAASGQLCSPLSAAKIGEGKKKKTSTLINQTWASSGPQLAFPMPSSTLSSFSLSL